MSKEVTQRTRDVVELVALRMVDLHSDHVGDDYEKLRDDMLRDMEETEELADFFNALIDEAFLLGAEYGYETGTVG